MALVTMFSSGMPRARGMAIHGLSMGLAMLLLSLAPAVSAQTGAAPLGWYVQGGPSVQRDRENQTLFFGVMLPRTHEEAAGPVTSYWDLYVGQWRGEQANRAQGRFSQVGAAVIWRRRLVDNASPWFGEGGLGISYLDGDYSIPDGRIFGSRLTFNGRLGIGRSFGGRAEHELSLNYLHFSNGGIKKPNPGMDLLQMRYAYRF